MYRNFWKLFWFLLPVLSFSFADGDGGGGTPPPALPPTPTPDPAPNQALQNLISRHNNDLMAVVSTLFTDNYQYRQDKRELTNQVKSLEGQLPKEGQVVLSKDDAALFEAYKALGSTEDLGKLQGELTTTREQLGALQKEGTLRDVAEVAKFKLPVLKTLGEKLDYEIREVEKDGKKEKAAFVKNDKGEFTPLADFAAANWADFLPALQQQAEPPKGTPFPNQNAGGGPAPKPNLVGDFIKGANEAREALPNPLVKKAAA